MITPQQRNAWRGAYLRELRKIAKSQVNPWLDEVEWENDKIEDRLTQFVFRDFVKLLKVVEYVFENHPLVLAKVDNQLITEDGIISEEQFYRVLSVANNYTRDGIISCFNTSEELKENVYNALKHNDLNVFLNFLSTIDTEEIRRYVGYVSRIFAQVKLGIRVLEGEELNEDDNTSVDNNSKELETRLNQANLNFSSFEDQLSKIANNTNLNLLSFSEEIQSVPQLYYSEVLIWSGVSIIVDAMFRPHELDIVKDVLRAWQFPEITEDLIHFTELLYGYHYFRLFV